MLDQNTTTLDQSSQFLTFIRSIVNSYNPHFKGLLCQKMCELI